MNPDLPACRGISIDFYARPVGWRRAAGIADGGRVRAHRCGSQLSAEARSADECGTSSVREVDSRRAFGNSRTHADYTSPSWTIGDSFFMAYTSQWMFGDAVLGRWNNWKSTVMWARFPMLLLTLLLGWVIYVYGSRMATWGGLLCLTLFVGTPLFVAIGPLVVTDIPVTLFTLVALWQLGEL